MASPILHWESEVDSRGQPADCPAEDSSWESLSCHNSDREEPQVASAGDTQRRGSEEAVCMGEAHANSEAFAAGSPDREGDVFIYLGDPNATSGSETESWAEEDRGGAQSDGSKGAGQGVSAAGVGSPAENAALLNGEPQAVSGEREQGSCASGTYPIFGCKVRVFLLLLLLTYCWAYIMKYSEVFYLSSTLILGALLIFLLVEMLHICLSKRVWEKIPLWKRMRRAGHPTV